MKCPYCENELNETDRFCPNCGGRNANFANEQSVRESAEKEEKIEKTSVDCPKNKEDSSKAGFILGITAAVCMIIFYALLGAYFKNIIEIGLKENLDTADVWKAIMSIKALLAAWFFWVAAVVQSMLGAVFSGVSLAQEVVDKRYSYAGVAINIIVFILMLIVFILFQPGVLG